MIRLLIAALLAAATLLVPTPGHAAGTATLDAVVPTQARARLAGTKVTTRVARPVRLQAWTGSGWSVVATGRTTKKGVVAFPLPEPAASTTYRILAPAHRVTVSKRIGGRLMRKKVRLAAWTGPSRTIAPVADPPAAPAGQQPDDRPTGQPEQPLLPSTRVLDASARPDGDVGAATPVISADGRWVAFDAAGGVVPGTEESRWNVYLHDTVTGATRLVSHDAAGRPGDDSSWAPRLSADGRYVAFQSYAGSFAAEDDNETLDVYIFDRVTDTVELVSRTATEVGDWASGEPDISADGRYVTFTTYADNLRPDTPQGDSQVVRVDRETGLIWPVSWPSTDPSHGSADHPSISGDGQVVAFTTDAPDLVSRDDNGTTDVLVYDFATGSLRAVSRALGQARPMGSGASTLPRISADGSTIVYMSEADDLVAGDDNEVTDVFRYDVAARTNELVSRNPAGRPADGWSREPQVSGDGRSVVFWSRAGDLAGAARGSIQAYLAEPGRPVELVSARDGSTTPGDAGAQDVTVSGDGRIVCFVSASTDLVPGVTAGVPRIYLRIRP